MPLLIDVKVGESVDIDEGKVVVTLLEKSGQRTRMEVVADKSIKIKLIKSPKVANIAAKGIKQPALAGT